MAAIFKIFKNESGAELVIFNKYVGDGESYDVPPIYWADAAVDGDLLALIASGDIIINDGTSDLPQADGVAWVKRWQQDDASDILFNPSGTVQTVVDELSNQFASTATSGFYLIDSSVEAFIEINFQSTTFGGLCIDGYLEIDGMLILET